MKEKMEELYYKLKWIFTTKKMKIRTYEKVIKMFESECNNCGCSYFVYSGELQKLKGKLGELKCKN